MWSDTYRSLEEIPDYMTASQKRRIRFSIARRKGDHSFLEWIEMKLFFEHTCCKCHGDSGLLNVEKDHIIPIYAGGSNSIRNIQPLCAKCNASKGVESVDYRRAFAGILGKQLPELYNDPF